jgi:hypothetical protein
MSVRCSRAFVGGLCPAWASFLLFRRAFHEARDSYELTAVLEFHWPHRLLSASRNSLAVHTRQAISDDQYFCKKQLDSDIIARAMNIHFFTFLYHVTTFGF